MADLREIGFALGRIFFGMVIYVEVLVLLIFINYLGVTASTGSEKVEVAFSGGHNQGYVQTYEGGYQKAYGGAYDKGYNKGYEIGLGSAAEEEVASLVELRNPTYKELLEFLAQDKTDSNPYISGEYVCFEFAVDLNHNAEVRGIRAAYVPIRFEEWGHAIVAFETVDRGLVFIEPQSDIEALGLQEGKPYPWQASGAVRTRDYNDIIVEIQIIW